LKKRAGARCLAGIIAHGEIQGLPHREIEKKAVARFEELSLEDLDKGEVVIRVAYSSVNYKDALAATGAGKIIRRFPCVGGIDLSGTVTESADARFSRGDAVICTSYDLGVAHDGGYAEYARVPADWVGPHAEGNEPFRSHGPRNGRVTPPASRSRAWRRTASRPPRALSS